MNLKDLKKEIPYKWRVQSFSKNKPSAQCVAYIDARDVEDILDEVVGAQSWQDDYKVVDGKLFAGIGIYISDQWVWKWDTGVESNIEKEKGQSSDAFKRSGVKWGVGRFLYKVKIRHVDANEKKTGSNYPYPVDKNGKRIWDLTAHINGAKPVLPKTQQPPSPPVNPAVITQQQGQSIFLKATANQWPMSAIKDHMKDICGVEKSAAIKLVNFPTLMDVLETEPMISKRQLARINILLDKVCPGSRQDQHNMVGDALQIEPPRSLNDLTWEQAEKANDVLFQLELQMAQAPIPTEETTQEAF